MERKPHFGHVSSAPNNSQRKGYRYSQSVKPPKQNQFITGLNR